MTPAVAALLHTLRGRGLTEPDGVDEEFDGIVVDALFHHRRSALLFDEPGQPRDTFALTMAGWDVLHIPLGADLDAVVDANPSIFARDPA